MKRLFIIILILVGMPEVNAKAPFEVSKKVPMAPLDTIWANEKMNLALFFPAEIRQGIVGSEDFVFTYNREKGQTLGLLKAVKGQPSNLLVITVDGSVYSYIIGYAERLSELNRFVMRNESIGNEYGMRESTKESAPTHSLNVISVQENGPNTMEKVDTKGHGHNPQKVTEGFIAKSCASLSEGPERLKKVKRKKGLSLGIRNMVYYNDLIFVQYEIGNKSGIDFDIRALELVKVKGNNRRKSSYQERLLEPLHTYGMPEKVRYGDTARFVRAYQKTTLGDGERFELRLVEDKGSREMNLKFRN